MSGFSPAHGDDTTYLCLAYDFKNYIDQGGIQDLLSKALTIHEKKPPLMIYYMTAMISIFGEANHALSFAATIVGLNIFFLINVFFFYKIVIKDSKSRNYFLLLFILSPLLFGLSKLVYVEFLLINLVLLSWTLIYKWRKDLSIKNALILGLVLGLGLYCKQTFLIFAALPLIYLLNNLDRSVIINRLFFILIGSSICLPWYFRNIFRTLGKFTSAANFERHSDGSVTDISTISSYLFDIGIAIGIFSLVAILALAITQRKQLSELISSKYLWVISIGPAINFIAFIFVDNKNERFQVISILMILILGSLILANSKLKIIKTLLLLAQVVLSFHMSFINIFPSMPSFKVLYATRPYSNIFNQSLAEKLRPLAPAEAFNYVDLREMQSPEEIYQHNKKNIRQSPANFKLLKAKHNHFACKFIGKARDKFMSTPKEYLLALSDNQAPQQIDTSILEGSQLRSLKAVNKYHKADSIYSYQESLGHGLHLYKD